MANVLLSEFSSYLLTTFADYCSFELFAFCCNCLMLMCYLPVIFDVKVLLSGDWIYLPNIVG